MKCSLLMFEAMNDPPTTYQGSVLPARKYSPVSLWCLRPAHRATREKPMNYPMIAK
jgi:hypothetical protein